MSKKVFAFLALVFIFSSLLLAVISSKSASAVDRQTCTNCDHCSVGYTRSCNDASHPVGDYSCTQTCGSDWSWGACHCEKLCDSVVGFTSLSCASPGKVKATCQNGGTVIINCGALTPSDRAKVGSCCANNNVPVSSSGGQKVCLVGTCIYDNCVEKQVPFSGGSCPSAGCTGSSQCLAKMKECTKDSDCAVDNPCVVASCKPSFVAEDEVKHIKRCHYDIFSKDFEPCGGGKYCYFGKCTVLTCSQFGGKCVDSIGKGYVEVNVSCSGGKVCEVKGFAKETPDEKKGYCRDNSSCLLSLPNKCVKSGNKSSYFVCENGVWDDHEDERLSLLSRFLLNFSRGEGFGVVGLFCGNSSVVFPRFVFPESSSGCVLSGDVGERVGGFVLSGSFNLSSALSVLNLSSGFCDNVGSSEGRWVKCKDNRVWLDSKDGLLVFSPSGVSFGGVSFWLDPFSVLVRFVRRLLYSGVVGVGDLAGYSGFDGLYYFVESRPFGVHRVVGVLNGSGLFVDFAGFCSNVSSFLPRGEGVVSFGNVSRHNFVFGVRGGSAGAVWPLVSGGLRVGGKGCACVPLSEGVVCSGLDCGFVGDGCGGFVDCGSCGSGGVCSGNHCCPSATPVWNGSACVRGNSPVGGCGGYDQSCCSSGVACYVNEGLVCNSSSVCSCPSGEVWNASQKKCVINNCSGGLFWDTSSVIFDKDDHLAGSITNLDSSHFVVATSLLESTVRVGHYSGGSVVWDTNETTFNPNGDTNYVSIVRLDSSHFVVAYENYSGPSSLSSDLVRVGHYSGGSVVWDTNEIPFHEGNRSFYVSIAPLSSKYFVIAYDGYTGVFSHSPNQGFIRVGHFNGSTVVWDTDELVFNVNDTSQISVIALKPYYFVVAYQNYSKFSPTLHNAGLVRVGYFDVSSKKIVWDVSSSLFVLKPSWAVVGVSVGPISKLNSSCFIVPYAFRLRNGSIKTFRGNYYTDSFIRIGCFNNHEVEWFNCSSTIRSSINVAGLNANYFIIAYANSSDKYEGIVRVGSFNRSLVSLSPGYLSFDSYWVNHIHLATLDSSRFIVAYNDNSVKGYIRVGSFCPYSVNSSVLINNSSSSNASSVCSSGEVCTCCKLPWGERTFVCEPGNRWVDPHYYFDGRCDVDCSSYGDGFRGYCVVDKNAPPVKECPLGELCACCEEQMGIPNSGEGDARVNYMCSLGGSVIVPPVTPLLRCSKSCGLNEKSYCVAPPNSR